MRRIRFWLSSAKRRRALEEEVELHIAEKTAELMENGWSKVEARQEARRRFGNVTRTVEDAQDVGTVAWLDLLVRDVRYAVRTLLRNPGFTTIIVSTLALGIGANSAIFSIVDRVLLRPLPYSESEQLVMLYESHSGVSGRSSVSTANWLDWQVQSASFESLSAWGSGEFSWQLNLVGEGYAERLNGQFVSEEFFTLLRVKPVLGRLFAPENHRPGAPQVVILSYGLWQRRFGGDPSVIGRTILLEAIPAEVIGVMPAGFHFVWPGTDVWEPLRVNRARDYRANPGNSLNVVGRLKPLVTVAAAETEMAAIASRLEQAYPSNKGVSVQIVPLREELTWRVSTALWALFAAVGILLLIACANFAGLLLARSASRRSEIALRASFGAGRSALVRQQMAESLMLALAGGVAGIMVARAVLSSMMTLVPPAVGQIGPISLDGRVLFYTLGISVLTGLVFGLAPAITTSRVSLIGALHAAGRSTPRTVRLRKGLVVSQVALTVVLLCVSGLLARSFRELTRVDPGLDPRGVLTLNVGLDGEPYDARGPEYVGFYRQAIERVESLPGVRSAAAAFAVPVTGGVVGETPFQIEGRTEVTPSERPRTNLRMVTPGYFRTLGIPIIQGRDFTFSDRRDSPMVFVVNQALANHFIRDRDPLSASLAIGNDKPYRTGRIIGVAGDTKEDSLRGQAEPTVFFTYSQIATSTDLFMFVRADNAEGLARAAIQAIREIDPKVPVYDVRLLEDVFAESIARERLSAVVSVAFALTALLLAASGVYGLLSFQVAQRTREIGIRIALGGPSSEVLRMILGESLRLIVPGVGLGLGAALLLTRLIESLLYGIAPRDPATFVAVAALIAAVGAVAAVAPARRATRVDPLVALRQE